MNNFDWDHGFVLDLDLISGLSQNADTTKRRLSQMKGMFYDQAAYERMLEQDDPLVYEFYELGFEKYLKVTTDNVTSLPNP